jgi:hypothetical protein
MSTMPAALLQPDSRPSPAPALVFPQGQAFRWMNIINTMVFRCSMWASRPRSRRERQFGEQAVDCETRSLPNSQGMPKARRCA